MTKPPLPVIITASDMTSSMEARWQVRQKAEKAIRNRYRVMHSHNGHPNLPHYVEFFETREKWYILSKLCQGGDLMSYVQRHGGKFLPEYLVQNITAILLSTLAYLHHYSVAHRDLKPTNVMLRDPNDIDSLCLVDFGSSFVTHTKDEFGPEQISPSPERSGGARDSFDGSASVDGRSDAAAAGPFSAEIAFHSMPQHNAPDMKTLTGTPFYLVS